MGTSRNSDFRDEVQGARRRVFGVRVQIHRAFGMPFGCDAMHRNEIGV